MNDNDIEQRLEMLLGSAPVVPAPEGLRRAVSAERAPLDERTAEGNQASPAPRPIASWRGRQARTISALAGLAATFVLAAGLLLIVVNRPTAPAVSPDTSGRIERIEWRSGLLPESGGFGLMAQLNGRVMYVGHDVWALDEPGGKWDKLTASPPFGTDDIIGIVEDGVGGLVAYGFDQVTVDDGVDSPAALVWRSMDGRTWTREGLGLGFVIKVVATASGLVAVGFVPKPAVGGCQSPEHAVAWTLKTDGTWAQSMLPGDGAAVTDAIVWRGRIVVVGARTCWQSEAGGSPSYPPDLSLVWTSSDGISWDRVAATGLSSGGNPEMSPTLASNGSTVVAFETSSLTKPLVTTDLSSWSAVSLPAQEGASSAVWWVAGAGSGYLAFGDGCALWASADGQTWRSVSNRPESIPSNFTCPGASVSGNRVAMPTGRNEDGSYGYLIGTIIRVEPAPSEAPPSASPTASTTASPSATASGEPTYSLELSIAKSWSGSWPIAMVTTADNYYAFLETSHGPTVWASGQDGTSWRQVADASAFGAAGAGGTTIVQQALSAPESGQIVAVGRRTDSDSRTDDSSIPYGVAWYSTDGASWQEASIDGPRPEAFTTLALFHGTFVASGGRPYYSTDGKTWHVASVEDPSHILTMGFMYITAWSGGLLAVSNEGNLTHWSSKDGTSWTQIKDWQGPTYALGYSHGSGIVAAISGPTTADPESPDGTFWWWSADAVTWERIEGPSPCLGVWRVGDSHLAAGPPVDSRDSVSLWLSKGGSPIWHRISGTAPYEIKRPRIAGAIGSRVVILELLVTGDQPSGATAWYGDLVEK